MKFSEQWLREWVSPALDVHALCEQLTMAGLEVDSIEPVAPPLDDILIARVAEVQPHPNADRLRVCQVDAGSAPIQVVCGAANVVAGMFAAFAPVNAKLPDGTKIKKAKLRGVESFGMLCSASELGLAETSAGLLELSNQCKVGQSIMEALALNDVSIDIDLTPNRGDCLSIRGIAREVGVMNQLPVAAPKIEPVKPSIEDQLPVELQAAQACPRYLGRVIRGVANAETPRWMQERLRRSGIRSLGPLVDVTNYVMLELGQPMHAFDLANIDQQICVRYARANEALILLDGREVKLDENTLVIADHSKVLALAGIMGGEASGCSNQTSDLFLECAFFTPACIAGKARNYNLHTDSSHRFERGVDFDLPMVAMERATALLVDIVGGHVGPVVHKCEQTYLPQSASIRLRQSQIERVLGATLLAQQIEEILIRLGLKVITGDVGVWQVDVPSYRFDLVQEVDLIEEIGRIVGYDELPNQVLPVTSHMVSVSESQVGLSRIKNLLVDRGYQEVITYSFIDPSWADAFADQREQIPLLNPISTEMSVMRPSLLPGLLKTVQHNQNRQQTRMRLFESGLTFGVHEEVMQQPVVLAGVILGDQFPQQWALSVSAVDFFDLKADVEAILALVKARHSVRFVAQPNKIFHPGQCAQLMRDTESLGWLGQIHPNLLRSFGIAGPVFGFEVLVETLTAVRIPQFRPLSRYPLVRRDLAIVVDQHVTVDAVKSCIAQTAPDIVQSIEVFDVYRGAGIEDGRKSLALGLILQDYSRTLTDMESEAVISKVIERLALELSATMRE